MNNIMLKLAVIEEFLSKKMKNIEISITPYEEQSHVISQVKRMAVPVNATRYNCTIIRGGKETGDIVNTISETPLLALYNAIVELATMPS